MSEIAVTRQDRVPEQYMHALLFSSLSFFFFCSLSLPSHSSSSFSSVSPPSFLPFSHLFLSSLPSYLSYSPSFLLFWTCLPFCSTPVFSHGKSGLSFGDRQCSDFDKKWNVPADPRLKKFSCHPQLWNRLSTFNNVNASNKTRTAEGQGWNGCTWQSSQSNAKPSPVWSPFTVCLWICTDLSGWLLLQYQSGRQRKESGIIPCTQRFWDTGPHLSLKVGEFGTWYSGTEGIHQDKKN